MNEALCPLRPSSTVQPLSSRRVSICLGLYGKISQRWREVSFDSCCNNNQTDSGHDKTHTDQSKACTLAGLQSFLE